LDLNNQATIKDVNGEDLKCVGDWNEMNSVNQFLSAVTTIHTQKDQSGDYVNICVDCVNDWLVNSSSIGCVQHAYRRKLSGPVSLDCLWCQGAT